MFSALRLTAIAAGLCCAMLVWGAANRSVLAGQPPVLDVAEDDSGKRAARLDELFGRLGTPLSAPEADAVTAEIWQLWMQSGRSDIDQLMQHAVAYMSLGHLQHALTTLDKVVALAPTYAEGWNKRATVLYMMDQHERSIADIDKTLALEPRHFGALSGMGLVRMAQGRWKAALDAFRRAVAVNPHLGEKDILIPMLEQKVEGEPI